MANPTKRWDRVPVYAWYFGPDDAPVTGEVEFKIDRRVHMADGTGIYPKFLTVTGVIGEPDATVTNQIRQAMRDAYQAANTMPTVVGPFDGAAWDAWWTSRLPAFMAASFYASDDPNISVDSQGYQVLVTERLSTGSGQSYVIEPLLAHLDLTPPGINLSVVYPPTSSPTVPAPVYAKGIPGGIAALDADGDVVDAEGAKVGGGLDETALDTYLTTNDYATDADVTAAVASKADASAVASALATKADASTTTSALATKAPLASPTFTGTVTVPNGSFTTAKVSGLDAALTGLDTRIDTLEASSDSGLMILVWSGTTWPARPTSSSADHYGWLDAIGGAPVPPDFLEGSDILLQEDFV